MHALVLLCISQHTTFEVPSFTDSKDMIVAKHWKSGSLDPDHAHYGVVFHHKANTLHNLPAYQIWWLISL